MECLILDAFCILIDDYFTSFDISMSLPASAFTGLFIMNSCLYPIRYCVITILRRGQYFLILLHLLLSRHDMAIMR